jgi:hypothetical protein
VKKRAPGYSRAVARIKFGKYQAAEVEVLRELEQCPDDFAGWMILADLYANHFHDLPEADRTTRELCQQSNLTGVQISVALHRLADWHLKGDADPVSARNALEEICRLLPESHFARMARLRIQQLPASRAEYLEKKKPKTFKLPAVGDDFDHHPAPAPEPDPAQARSLADHCVEKLRRDPNDVAVRERFAILLAERLGEADVAIEQLELLLAMPDQPEAKSAEWLALMATWQDKFRAAHDASRRTLERLIRLHPRSPQAFAAQCGLNRIDVDERFREGRANMK